MFSLSMTSVVFLVTDVKVTKSVLFCGNCLQSVTCDDDILSLCDFELKSTEPTTLTFTGLSRSSRSVGKIASRAKKTFT